MRWILLFCCALPVLAQGGTEPKPKPEDYDVHAQSRDIVIGAEFMIHSFSGEEAMYIAKDYLVVEVALYPPKGGKLEVHPEQFGLRLNGKKTIVAPSTPQMVSTSLQNPAWDSGPHMEGGGGMGNAGVILGRPPSTIPGQPPPQSPLPRAPDAEAQNGVPRPPRVRPDELVLRTALQPGTYSGPAAGFVFFPYRGRTASLHSVELLFEDAVLKLR